MAEIFPFRALHYNSKKIPTLEQVITQPYDKITPEMQARYYDLSPYNLARIIRGRQNPSDTPQDNVYSRAKQFFQEWIEEDILVSESQPALYAYDQEYCIPGRKGSPRRRRGFIALCRIEDYSAGIIHRHEETLSAPKVDRLELLKATRAHFGQIFVLYSDPGGTMESMLATHPPGPVWQRLTDEYGSLHSVFRVADRDAIEQVTEAMRDKKLVIADGHHRYETALAYRDYCRAQSLPDDRAEYVMMTFVRMESPGLTILPTHRAVFGLSRFDWTQFAGAARQLFDWEEVKPARSLRGQTETFLEALGKAGRERMALGAYAGPGRLALLRLRGDADFGRILADLPPGLRRLDVVILHRLILENLLEIDRLAVQQEKNLRYVREAEEAAQQVESGQAQVCFLMNPTPIQAVWENALAGHPLPQKSTDFYPKLLSGLAIYWLDNPLGM